MKRTLLACLTGVTVACSAAEEAPMETGKVTWGRDLEDALEASSKSGKPVFLLFQEVPGCGGCKQFGKEVLSNPLLVDAIEAEFVPLLIHNNKGGRDKEVLTQFKEPAWNYQVVRFLDAKGKDLIPRKDKVWDTGPLADRMIASLQKADRSVPGYLTLLEEEHASDLKQVAFAMHCFWTGEAKLGAIDGVITTEAGWIGGKEVTLLNYDESRISLPKLVREAEALDCAHSIFLPEQKDQKLAAGRLQPLPLKDYRRAKESDQKKQLQGTSIAKIELTESQATKVNAWIRTDKAKALTFLSPQQFEALR